MKKRKLSEVELSYRVLSHLRAAGRALNELMARRGLTSPTLEVARAQIEQDWRKAMGAMVVAKVWGSANAGRN